MQPRKAGQHVRCQQGPDTSVLRSHQRGRSQCGRRTRLGRLHRHEQVPGLASGKAGTRQLFELFHAAFDEAALEVDEMIAEGDKVFALVRMTGIQRGEFMGIPATGNTIAVNICDYFRIDNGMLIEHWGVLDAAAMMQQLTAH